MGPEEQLKWLNILMILSVLCTPILVVIIANISGPFFGAAIGIFSLIFDGIVYLWYRGKLEREL